MQFYSGIINFKIEADRKLIWLKITIALALSLGFILSWRLWISSRLFPLCPVSDSLPGIPFPFDYIWFVLLLALLLSISYIACPRRLILAFLALAVLLSLFDQMRWQPWFYQYIFMLAALGFYAWRKPENKSNRVPLNVCRLIIVCTYFWSGLQKLNVNFIREVWPDMTGPLLRWLPHLPPFLILILPLLEICIGLGLLARRFRNLSVILAVATHIVILLLLISTGENTVVWPWNIAMIFFVVVLFWQDNETSSRKILIPKNAFHVLVLILFGVLPALSSIELWDSYLSSALYSGNTDQAIIYVSPYIVGLLPATIHSYIWQNTEPFFLDINRWAYGELNVPVYPETRVYLKVARQICTSAARPDDVKLRIKRKPNPLTGLRESEYYDCNHVY
jgi:hypothetical protein